MSTYLELEKILGDIRKHSKNSMHLTIYSMSSSYLGYEVYFSWPNGTRMAFTVSYLALAADMKKALAPHLEKVIRYDEILSSPLMQAMSE
jgi:hypothetical protein